MLHCEPFDPAAQFLITQSFIRPPMLQYSIGGLFRSLCLSVVCLLSTSLCIVAKFHPKPSQVVFSTVFLRYNFLPEVDSGVVSDIDGDNASLDVHVKCGDSRSNSFRDIRGADFVSN